MIDFKSESETNKTAHIRTQLHALASVSKLHAITDSTLFTRMQIHKIISRTTVFNIDNWAQLIQIEYQISILEWTPPPPDTGTLMSTTSDLVNVKKNTVILSIFLPECWGFAYLYQLWKDQGSSAGPAEKLQVHLSAGCPLSRDSEPMAETLKYEELGTFCHPAPTEWRSCFLHWHYSA